MFIFTLIVCLILGLHQPVPSSVEDHIAAYNWPHREAMTIAKCESGLDPDRHGDRHLPHLTDGYGSVGLFQINVGNLYRTRHHALRHIDAPSSGAAIVEWLKVPANNVYVAHVLWQAEGWRPWKTCSKKL